MKSKSFIESPVQVELILVTSQNLVSESQIGIPVDVFVILRTKGSHPAIDTPEKLGTGGD